MHVVVQIHCALGNTFIIIKPSLNARQDCASWPHKADTIIVKIVSLIDSREKTEAIQCKKTGGATDFRRKLFKFSPLKIFSQKYLHHRFVQMLFWMILCDHESLFHHRLVLPCASRPHRDSKHLCFWDPGSWSAPILDLVEFARWLRKYWHDCKEFATDWFQGETQYGTVADVPESWVWWRADFQSCFRVLKRCFEPFLIYIYGIQCDFMPKSCWKHSNFEKR